MGSWTFSPWDLLGVPVGASIEDVRSAYKKKSLKCHPDMAQKESKSLHEIEQTTENFKYIEKSHTMLSDANLRGFFMNTGTNPWSMCWENAHNEMTRQVEREMNETERECQEKEFRESARQQWERQERDRQERERQEKERQQRDRQERERQERERQERERQEKERQQRERLERERQQRERGETEKDYRGPDWSWQQQQTQENLQNEKELRRREEKNYDEWIIYENPQKASHHRPNHYTSSQTNHPPQFTPNEIFLRQRISKLSYDVNQLNKTARMRQRDLDEKTAQVGWLQQEVLNCRQEIGQLKGKLREYAYVSTQLQDLKGVNKTLTNARNALLDTVQERKQQVKDLHAKFSKRIQQLNAELHVIKTKYAKQNQKSIANVKRLEMEVKNLKVQAGQQQELYNVTVSGIETKLKQEVEKQERVCQEFKNFEQLVKDLKMEKEVLERQLEENVVLERNWRMKIEALEVVHDKERSEQFDRYEHLGTDFRNLQNQMGELRKEADKHKHYVTDLTTQKDKLQEQNENLVEQLKSEGDNKLALERQWRSDLDEMQEASEASIEKLRVELTGKCECLQNERDGLKKEVEERRLENEKLDQQIDVIQEKIHELTKQAEREIEKNLELEQNWRLKFESLKESEMKRMRLAEVMDRVTNHQTLKTKIKELESKVMKKKDEMKEAFKKQDDLQKENGQLKGQLMREKEENLGLVNDWRQQVEKLQAKAKSFENLTTAMNKEREEKRLKLKEVEQEREELYHANDKLMEQVEREIAEKLALENEFRMEVDELQAASLSAIEEEQLKNSGKYEDLLRRFRELESENFSLKSDKQLLQNEKEQFENDARRAQAQLEQERLASVRTEEPQVNDDDDFMNDDASSFLEAPESIGSLVVPLARVKTRRQSPRKPRIINLTNVNNKPISVEHVKKASVKKRNKKKESKNQPLKEKVSRKSRIRPCNRDFEGVHEEAAHLVGYTCTCTSTFTRKSNLTAHINSFIYEFPCPTCGKVFGRHDSMKRHANDIHNVKVM